MLTKMESYITGLPDYIKDSLEWYTGGNFDTLNEKLRKDSPLSELQQYHFDNIKEAFRNCPELSDHLVVYKGKSSRTVYSDKAFVSTSLKYEQSLKFSGKTCCVLEILVSPGSKVLPLYLISRYPEEQEILLDKEGSLTVTQTVNQGNMIVIKCVYTSNLSIKVEDETDFKYLEITRRFKEIVSEEELELYEEEDLPGVISEVLTRLEIKHTKRDVEKIADLLK